MKEKEFNRMITERRAELLLFASGFVKSRNDAEDIVQECIMRLWECFSEKKGQKEDKIGKPYFYLLRMVKNKCTDYHRRKNRVEENGGTSDLHVKGSPMHESPIDEIIRKETADFVRRELEKLPYEQQAVFRMKEIMGYENSEIAEILETSEANIRQLLSRARKHLKDSISR